VLRPAAEAEAPGLGVVARGREHGVVQGEAEFVARRAARRKVRFRGDLGIALLPLHTHCTRPPPCAVSLVPQGWAGPWFRFDATQPPAGRRRREATAAPLAVQEPIDERGEERSPLVMDLIMAGMRRCDGKACFRPRDDGGVHSSLYNQTDGSAGPNPAFS
jgi:hypothetical protein